MELVTELVQPNLYRFTPVSRSRALRSVDERVFTPHSVATKSEEREIGEPPSFFVLTPEPAHSPFSNKQQVITSAANGKLNRIKIHGGAGGGGF